MSNIEIPILRLFPLFGISMVFFDIQYAPKKIEYKNINQIRRSSDSNAIREILESLFLRFAEKINL